MGSVLETSVGLDETNTPRTLDTLNELIELAQSNAVRMERLLMRFEGPQPEQAEELEDKFDYNSYQGKLQQLQAILNSTATLLSGVERHA